MGDVVRNHVVGALVEDAVKSLGKAVRGDGPFAEPQSWGVNSVLRMSGALQGDTSNLEAAVLGAVGASVGIARTAVSAYRNVEGVLEDRDAIASNMLDWLEDYYRAKGRRVLIVADGAAA